MPIGIDLRAISCNDRETLRQPIGRVDAIERFVSGHSAAPTCAHGTLNYFAQLSISCKFDQTADDVGHSLLHSLRTLCGLFAELGNLLSNFAQFEGHGSSSRTRVHYTYSPEQNQAILSCQWRSILARSFGLM
jgi:hypothetical protein